MTPLKTPISRFCRDEKNTKPAEVCCQLNLIFKEKFPARSLQASLVQAGTRSMEPWSDCILRPQSCQRHRIETTLQYDAMHAMQENCPLCYSSSLRFWRNWDLPPKKKCRAKSTFEVLYELVPLVPAPGRKGLRAFKSHQIALEEDRPIFLTDTVFSSMSW